MFFRKRLRLQSAQKDTSEDASDSLSSQNVERTSDIAYTIQEKIQKKAMHYTSDTGEIEMPAVVRFVFHLL